MKRLLAWIGVLSVIAVAGALVVARSGVVPIAASDDHFPPIAWFLHFTMKSSVRDSARDIKVPADIDLTDPTLIARGAGHYALACASCHGAPGVEQALLPRRMLPYAPVLGPTLPEWKDRELFWIVRHGIRYSGMPGWANQTRADDVWPVVAFLRALNQLSAEDYRELAYGDLPAPLAGSSTAHSPAPGAILTACNQCHGRDGMGRDGVAPVLAGQSAEYLETALAAYAAGERYSGLMQPQAYPLTESARRQLASHYANLPWRGPPTQRAQQAASPALIQRGRKIAQHGIAKDQVPQCVECHGVTQPANPSAPSLAGQAAWYIEQQLHLFRAGQRGGGPKAHQMTAQQWTLNDADYDEMAKATAAFYATVEP